MSLEGLEAGTPVILGAGEDKKKPRFYYMFSLNCVFHAPSSSEKIRIIIIMSRKRDRMTYQRVEEMLNMGIIPLVVGTLVALDSSEARSIAS